MSYCRFENTLEDLRDCEENLFDKLYGRELEARERLVKLCHRIAEQVPLNEIAGLPVDKEMTDNEE